MYSQAHKEIRLNGLAAREGGKLQAKRIEKNQLQHLKIVDCAFLTSKTFELYICIDHEYTGCRKKYRQPIFVILKCALPHLPPPPDIYTNEVVQLLCKFSALNLCRAYWSRSNDGWKKNVNLYLFIVLSRWFFPFSSESASLVMQL